MEFYPRRIPLASPRGVSISPYSLEQICMPTQFDLMFVAVGANQEPLRIGRVVPHGSKRDSMRIWASWKDLLFQRKDNYLERGSECGVPRSLRVPFAEFTCWHPFGSATRCLRTHTRNIACRRINLKCQSRIRRQNYEVIFQMRLLMSFCTSDFNTYRHRPPVANNIWGLGDALSVVTKSLAATQPQPLAING